MSTHLNLVSELEQLANELEADASPRPEVTLASIGERIAKIVGVRPDEVALLGLSTKWRHLYFLAPQALRNVGQIPLSSPSALAARTAREGRPEINNNFVKSRHANVFEGVRVSGETIEAIQKIISAPILADGKVVGVIQISRKGPKLKGVGPDFTAADLGDVLALCKPLGRLLQSFAAE
jgi:GAF domain-containing protein